MRGAFFKTFSLVVIGCALLGARAHASEYSSSKDSPKFGTYLGYGISFPRSFGGGITLFRFFNFGLSGTTKSTALTVNVNARALDSIISPIFGLSANYYSIKAGDVPVPGYSDGLSGLKLTMNAGLGVQPSPGFCIDAGITYLRGGNFQPYVQVSWPIKVSLD